MPLVGAQCPTCRRHIQFELARGVSRAVVVCGGSLGCRARFIAQVSNNGPTPAAAPPPAASSGAQQMYGVACPSCANQFCFVAPPGAQCSVACQNCSTRFVVNLQGVPGQAPDPASGNKDDAFALSEQQQLELALKMSLDHSGGGAHEPEPTVTVTAEASDKPACAICLSEKMEDPQALLCGHVYCTPCLKQWHDAQVEESVEQQRRSGVPNPRPDAAIGRQRCPVCRLITVAAPSGGGGRGTAASSASTAVPAKSR